MTILCVLPGPSCEVAISPDDRPARWCFKCRQHLPHMWALMDDPPERQPSYYDPITVCRCSQCGEDHTGFPGSWGAVASEAVWKTLVEQGAATRAAWDWDAIWARFREEESA